jgi:CRP-like cAMP-binding protein
MPAPIALSYLPPQTNRLLATLTPEVQQPLLAQCQLVSLQFAEQLCLPEQAYQFVYFPLTSFISLIAKLPGHPPLEMALIGFEGMLGATLLLQSRQVPLQAIVQGAGLAWQMPVTVLEQHLSQHAVQPDSITSGGPLRPAIQRYLLQLLTQQSQNAICAHFHQVEERLARWLLMSQDRYQQQQLYLTQQFLADMLGVRRSSITVAAGDLQLHGLIRYQRGQLQILDRPGLLQRSCSCYQPLLLN